MTHFTLKLSAVSVASILFLAAKAPAAVYFQDNFETAPEVSTAAPVTGGDVDADPVAQVGSWRIKDKAGPNSEQVTNFSPPGAHGGNNYARMTDSTDSQLHADLTSAQTGDLTLDAWVNVTNAVGVRIFLQEGATDNANGWLTWGEAGSGFMGYRFGGSWNITTVPYVENTWQHLTVVMHVASDTMDLTLDGNTQTAIPFNSAASNIGNIFFASGGLTQRAYIDDVVVFTGAIPEPSPLALLGLSSALGTRRRR